ncbi:MAG: tail fiber domain-containing protein [Saprospiraceae bacterium]|nr:tail fiber domain-containing protein [Candidatus Opimibacter iunctus]
MKLKFASFSIFFFLICPLHLFSQKVGINTINPTSPLTVQQPSGQELSTGSTIMNIKYTGTFSTDVIGLNTEVEPQPGYGIGGQFIGGRTGGQFYGQKFGIEVSDFPQDNETGWGVYSYVSGDGGDLTGVSGIVNGVSNTSKTGVYGRASGTSEENIGIFGSAFGGSINWAGYFDIGNVYVKDNLALGLSQTPGVNLDILDFQSIARLVSTNNTNGSVLELRNTTTTPLNYGAINFGPTGSTPGQIAYLATNNLTFRVNGTERLRINPSGLLGIGRTPATNRLEVEGTASKSTAGDWLANSDARLKKNIEPLNEKEMIEKLLALKGVTYEWNDDKTGSQRPEGIQYGFTAQNIQEVFPTLVEEDAKGYLQTAYGTYDAMTIEAIRYLYLENQQLKQDIKEIRQLLGTTAGK